MTDGRKNGNGKPPESGRWKKGQSGNPNGRPKRKLDFVADYASILSKPVKAIQIDGSTVTLGSLEAAFVQLFKKALNDDDAALFNAIKIMLGVLPEGQKAEEERFNEFHDAKAQFMEMVGLPEDE